MTRYLIATVAVLAMTGCNTVDTAYNLKTKEFRYKSQRLPLHDVEVGEAEIVAPDGTKLTLRGVKTDSQRAMEAVEFAAKAAMATAQREREDRIAAEAKADAAGLFDDDNADAEPEGDE